VVTGKDEFQDLYQQCLQNELTYWKSRLECPLATLYFGGGTPSRFRPDLWQRLMDGITSRFEVETGVEVSAEANPESLTSSLLSQWLGLGVNRVSIGVQTFHDSLLPLLDRRHTTMMARQVIEALKTSNLPTWSLDLIYGLPGQSLSNWNEDLAAVLEIGPPHVSFYNLILHPGLPTTQKALAALEPDHEETQSEMFLEAVHRFEEGGYEVYELSNAALPGHACRHNQLYWSGGEWIGIGLSASSYFDGQYFSNPASWEAYLSAWRVVPQSLPVSTKTPSLEARLLDLVMLRLRTAKGLDLHEVESLLGREIPAFLQGLIRDMRTHGYLMDSRLRGNDDRQETGNVEVHGEGLNSSFPRRRESIVISPSKENLRLSPKGWLLHSEITTRIVDCLLGSLG
jgi:putative oxygen-independent coproporphyrinogen III oxidase